MDPNSSRIEQDNDRASLNSDASSSTQAGSPSKLHLTSSEGQLLPRGHVFARKIRIPQKRQISPFPPDPDPSSVEFESSNSQVQLSEPPSKTMIMSLESLKEIRTEMKQLANIKQKILDTSAQLDVKQNLEESFQTEQRVLFEEKKKALELLRGIQADIESANRMEEQVKRQKENLAGHLRFLRDNIYPSLKDKMDELRSAQGLERLPNLHELMEADMARYLEQRRQYAVSSSGRSRGRGRGCGG